MKAMTMPVWQCLPLRSRQSGVGLIEVLVAVLILSIGFLGIAAF